MNAQIITEPGPVDPRTGTRRLDLWRQDATGGMWGDLARGDGYSSRYVSDDGHGCAEVDVYPVEAEWGWDVCEQVTAGRAVYEPDGTPCPGGQGYRCEDGEWTELGEGVACRTCHGHGVMPRPDDAADIEYDYPHPYVIHSLSEAQRIAERIGTRDYSYALNLRAPTTATEIDR